VYTHPVELPSLVGEGYNFQAQVSTESYEDGTSDCILEGTFEILEESRFNIKRGGEPFVVFWAFGYSTNYHGERSNFEYAQYLKEMAEVIAFTY
jgi:hypothetical protein